MPLFDIFRKHKKEENEKSIENPSPQEQDKPAEVPEAPPIETVTQEPEITVEPAQPEVEAAKEPEKETEVAVEPLKEPETEKPVEPVQEPEPIQEPKAEIETPKIYLKAVPLRNLSDIETIKSDINNGNILILKMTPLASKSIEDVKSAVNELSAFAESIGGDIARLGEERVVICPKNIRIWREKKSVSSEPVPTAA